MDHSEVNDRFVADFLAAHGPCRGGEILDVGTGTARIPIALARADPQARILALDLAQNMLGARRREHRRGRRDGSHPLPAAGTSRGWRDSGKRGFRGVISNTIIHHIPDPAPALEAMKARVAPGGTLMVRDLARPDSREEVARLVELYAGRKPRRPAGSSRPR